MSISTTTDIAYSSDGVSKLDVYHDPDHANGAAVIDIHGGGWFRGSKDKDADWASRLAAEGYLVVVPEYHDVPDGYYPAPLEDMDHVWQWLQASDLTFDRHRIGAVGSSAGGNMSVELAIKYGIPAVSLSGILDIDDWLTKHADVVPAPDNPQNFAGASSGINQGGANDAFYKWFIMNYFHERTDRLTEGTPVHRVSPKTGPVYLANSLNEFVPTSGVLTFTEAMVRNDVPVVAQFLSGSRHAKGYLDDVYDQTVQFLNHYLLEEGRPES